jgi:hypothetical protein
LKIGVAAAAATAAAAADHPDAQEMLDVLRLMDDV